MLLFIDDINMPMLLGCVANPRIMSGRVRILDYVVSSRIHAPLHFETMPSRCEVFGSMYKVDADVSQAGEVRGAAAN